MTTPARPPVYAGFPYWQVAALAVGLWLFRAWRIDGLAGENNYNLWLYYAIIVIGFYFVFGLAGQFAFSQAAFVGLGAYVSSWATRDGEPFLVGLAAAVLITGVVAAMFALLIRRASHFYFAIATLGLAEILLLVFRTWEGFTGGLGGEIFGARPISVAGITASTATEVFWILLGTLSILLVGGMWLHRSPARREAIAVRDAEVVSSTLGLPVIRIRVTMFVLGSAIAAMAGSLFVHWKGFATPEAFGVDLALGVFLMLILGGIHSLWGPVLGAWFFVYVPLWLRDFDEYREIIYGVTLIVTMVAVPEGLIGSVARLRHVGAGRAGGVVRRWMDRAPTSEAPSDEVEPGPAPVTAVPPSPPRRSSAAPPAEPVDREVLRAERIGVSFGGVVAVDDVTLSVNEGEVLGLVGPNGSGKSTFLNALSGVVDARGSVAIEGEPLRLSRPAEIKARGVGRTYQTPQTYHHLTCIENVLLSTTDRRATGIMVSWLARPIVLAHERPRWERAAHALERVDLSRLAHEPASGLAYGQHRMLELARAIAGEPQVLLLDEPSAGLNASETEDLDRILHGLRTDGVSLLVVDHKLDFITSLCDRVAVLQQGRLVAVGETSSVFDDRRVVDAYLGVERTG